jgi:hypothetical protein
MAGQCPRGRPDATQGCLHRRWHRCSTGSTHWGCFHLRCAATNTSIAATLAPEREATSTLELEQVPDWQNPKQGKGSPCRGVVHWIQVEEEVGGVKAHRLPQVATAETTRDGRDSQAAATTTSVAGEVFGRGRGEWARRVGLGRFARPRNPTDWFGPARWAGLTSGRGPKCF